MREGREGGREGGTIESADNSLALHRLPSCGHGGHGQELLVERVPKEEGGREGGREGGIHA